MRMAVFAMTAPLGLGACNPGWCAPKERLLERLRDLEEALCSGLIYPAGFDEHTAKIINEF